MNNDLMKKLKAASNLKHTTTLSKSTLFTHRDNITVDVPIINLAFSGHFNKGFGSGLIMFVGPSKHFKSNLGLITVKAYLKTYPDAICLYYDSEFGCTPEYIQSAGIDPDRVLHIPIMNIEELKFDFAKQLQEIKKGDKVIIFIDSVGNLASKKEVDDAINEKAVADMTRAKQLKSLWRMVTPYLTIHDIPCVVINHSYSSMDLFPSQVVSGGQGGVYSSNTIFMIGKSQEKEDNEIAGYKFTLNIEKSRYVKEKAKFPFVVTYEKGVNIYSGLLDIAMETGHVIKPKVGWYSRPCVQDDKSWRAKDTNTGAFWKPIFETTDFKEVCTKKYSLGTTQLISEEEILESAVDLSNIDIDADEE